MHLKRVSLLFKGWSRYVWKKHVWPCS